MIIEVDGQSLVGVTQIHAANVLKSTSNVVTFLLGREQVRRYFIVRELHTTKLQKNFKFNLFKIHTTIFAINFAALSYKSTVSYSL